MFGWRARIGQIRPASAIEGSEEWRRVAPEGVAFVDGRTIVEAFVSDQHVERPFHKRERERADPEALARRVPIEKGRQ